MYESKVKSWMAKIIINKRLFSATRKILYIMLMLIPFSVENLQKQKHYFKESNQL